MSVVDLVKRTGFRLHRAVGQYPWLYYPCYRLFGPYRRLTVGPDTELVIEGYPRSSNTFAVVAFEHAQQRPVKIAHHLHVPAQVIAGVQRGIPVVVLLRRPIDAICSLVIREPYLSLQTALQDYVDFHQRILPYRAHFLVAPFEEVTTDYGAVIRRLNAQFATDYRPFIHSQDNVDRVFAGLEALERHTALPRTDETKVARPSRHRAEKGDELRSALLSSRYSKALELALGLHEELLGGTRPSDDTPEP